MNCPICCHETRNAMLAVVYFAKQVKKKNPDMATALLDAALVRLDKQLMLCAASGGDEE